MAYIHFLEVAIFTKNKPNPSYMNIMVYFCEGNPTFYTTNHLFFYTKTVSIMQKMLFIALMLLFTGEIMAQNNSTTADSVYYYGKNIPKAEYNRLSKRNFESWFMPGLAYTYYQPKISDSLGYFSGVAVEYLIYANVQQSDSDGPSHVRLYSKFNILRSSKKEISSLFLYTAGLDLSIEKNPRRTFLIPYFGLEFGGMSQKTVGSTVQFTPTVGVHLLSTKNLFINAHGGYLYPIKNFESMQGWFAQVGANFALW